MSMKRQATTELNRDNWDQDDSADHEEMGTFKPAAKEILEKRVIRTAKRRSQLSSGDESKKGVFSAFGGFNKKQPSSFDFLANLTNGDQPNVNGSGSNKSEATVSSSLFSSKPTAGSTGIGSGLFNVTVTSSTSKSMFTNDSTTTKATSSLFAIAPISTTNTGSIFTATKADSTVGDSLFKIQPTPTSTNNSSSSQVTSTMFAVPSTNANNLSLFASSTPKTTSFKIQPVSSTTTAAQKALDTVPNISINNKDKIDDKKNNIDGQCNAKKLMFYGKLKNLNESVSAWIKQNVDESPLCILSPIFKDYERYLKELQDEYQGVNNNMECNQEIVVNESNKNSTDNLPISVLNKPSIAKPASSLFTNYPANNIPFSINNDKGFPNAVLSSNFSFGVKPTANASDSNTTKDKDNAVSSLQTSASPTATSLFSTNIGSTGSSFTSGIKPTVNVSYSNTTRDIATSNITSASSVAKPTTSLFSSISVPGSSTLSSFGTKTSIESSDVGSNFIFGIKPVNTSDSNTVKQHVTSIKASTSPVAKPTTSLFTNISAPSGTASPFGPKTVVGKSDVGPKFTFGINNTVNVPDPNTSKENANLNIQTSTPPVAKPMTSLFSNTSNTASPFGSKINVGSSDVGPNFSFGIKAADNVLDSNNSKENTTSNILSASPKATSVFSNSAVPSAAISPFGVKTEMGSSAGSPPNFSFGNKTSLPTTTTATTPSFTFGIKPSPQSATSISSASMVFGQNPLQNSSSGAPPFSFGTGKPFSFNLNVQSKPENQNQQTEENDDEPPKVEFTPVVEENSVYDKKCKIFVKKDGNFVDKGVGTIYIKKLEVSSKYQLLIRANTNLGTILLNLILAKSIPIQRSGKNNVMMVCIPIPDSDPSPTPILIRVKTAEEADELLETLNKYKT